jgi:transcription initiation factor TFIID subunit TAF12
METKFTGPANTQKGKTSTTPPASLPVPPQASASLTLQGQLGNRDMGALLRTMGQSASASPMVQRKCSACEEEDQIHRRVDPSAGPAPARGSAPVVPGPGSPIEPGT